MANYVQYITAQLTQCFVFHTGTSLWSTVAKCLKVEKVARRSTIQRDGHRTPSVELLYGSDGWVQHKDNNIRSSKKTQYVLNRSKISDFS